jgi:hypothetical protein
MIGVVIPGVPLITGGPLTNNNVVIDVNNPKTVNNITLFQTEALPDDCGAALYYSVPPYESLQFIGCVCNIRPSDVFYTGWSLNPNVNVFQQIKICVKLDKLSNLKMAFEEKIKVDINQEFAMRVAKNLYNFLDSFNQNQDPNKNILVVPINTLEKWYDKFNQNYKMDPNFIMKTEI